MKLNKILSFLLIVLGGVLVLLAGTFLVAAIHASATIPDGQVNDAGFGLFFALAFGIVGLALLGFGWACRVRRPDRQ